MKEDIKNKAKDVVNNIKNETRIYNPPYLFFDEIYYRGLNWFDNNIPIIKDNNNKKEKTMKGILEFNLDNPQDQKAHLRATKATNVYIALYQIIDFIDNRLNYEDELDVVQKNELLIIKDSIVDIIDELDIDLYNELDNSY